MDIDFVVDPTPVVNETTTPVTATPTAPEASIALEVAVIILPAPPVPPEALREKNLEKSAVISVAASGEVQTPPISISVDVSVEHAIVGGLKESLAKASEFELRLREPASDAELLKKKMHVSTYVSPPPTGCPNNSTSELFLFSPT